MEQKLKLYMVLLGCTPKGRLTEQHDIFFGIGNSMESLVEDIYAFWPDGGQLHVDSWREVTIVNSYEISVVPKQSDTNAEKLFFLNLGGYKPGEFEEYHYKTLTVAKTMGKAIKATKQTSFYKHFGFKGAESHIDEKYAIDVDDMHNIENILAPHLKDKYSLQITKTAHLMEDELHIGYLKLKR